MISINDFKKYHWAELEHYETELHILDDMKYHNPRVKEVQTVSLSGSALIHPIKVNHVTLSKKEFKEFETEPFVTCCKMKE